MIRRFFIFVLFRLLRNTFTQSWQKHQSSVLSFPLEKIWSQEQNIKTSIKHGQSNWISVITLSWFIEAQFKLSVQWNATSFGADVGNSFVSSFQLEFQLVFPSPLVFCLVFFWGIVGSRRPPLSELNIYYWKLSMILWKHDHGVDQWNRTSVNKSTLKSLHPATGGKVWMKDRKEYSEEAESNYQLYHSEQSIIDQYKNKPITTCVLIDPFPRLIIINYP